MDLTRAEVEGALTDSADCTCLICRVYRSWLARDAEREKIVAALNALLEAIEADVGFRFDNAWAHRKLQDAVTHARALLATLEGQA